MVHLRMATNTKFFLCFYFYFLLLLASTFQLGTTSSSLQLFLQQTNTDTPERAFAERQQQKQHRHRHRHGFGTGSLEDFDDPDGVKTKAISRLLEVFGIHPPDGSNALRGSRAAYEPPQYMVDLYNSIADNSGESKKRKPYDANIIRSFPDRDLDHQLLFSFNVSGVERAESVLQAELHVYKMRPTKGLQSSISSPVVSHQSDPHSHLLEMRVYQVLERSKESQEDGNRLLDARRISALSVGWEVFRVKAAVLDWIKNETTNHGLLVTLRTVSGERVNDFSIVRIAKRHRHSNKQPILVIFSNDDRTRYDQTTPSATASVAPDHVTRYPTSLETSSSGSDLTEDGSNQRPIRSASASGSVSRPRPTVAPLIEATLNGTSTSFQPSPGSSTVTNGQECTRQELLVDFQQIGWAGWIISPTTPRCRV